MKAVNLKRTLIAMGLLLVCLSLQACSGGSSSGGDTGSTLGGTAQ